MPSFTFAATAAAVLYCGGTPVFAEIVSREQTRASTPRTSRGASRPRTKAVVRGALRRLRRRRSDRLRELCDAHGLALIEDVAHAPSATLARAQARHLGPGGRVQLLLQQGPLGGRGRPAVHRRRRGRRVRALAPLARDDERHLGPPQRAHRHLRRGRPRLQLPPRRAARRAAALAPGAPGGGHRPPARADAPLPRAAGAGRRDHRAVRRRATCRAPPAT